jgi:4-amino-4-deoxy-L-arabinose transferase-like glycosyltransferase
MWVQEAGPIALRAPGPWDTYLGLAGGGEALFAWAMLPGRSDTLVGLADALVWPLLGLAVAAAGREAGLRWRAALQAAAFVMAIPAALLSAGTNYVDNLLAFLLLAALAFALRALCRGDARAALACCAALGLAFGVKLTALGPAAAMVAMLSLRGARAGAHERRQASWRAISLGLVLAAAAGLPWYVDNWRRTGLPFSPYPVRLLGFTLGGSETFDWYAKQSVGTPFSIDELVALRSMFHEPFQPSLGPMTVLAILLFPMALVRLWRRDRWSAGLAGLLALSALATYVSGPFAATRLGWASVNGRYFLMPVALCVLLGYRVGGRAYAAALGVASVLNVLLLSGVGISAEEADLVLGHVLLCVALFWLVSRVSAGPRRAAAAVLAVAAFAASVALWRETRRHELIAAGMRLHPIHKYWVGAAARLDALGPLRIAITAGPLQKGDHWFTYPFLGSHLQHRLVYLPTSADGALYLPNDPRAAENANADAWIERVRTSNVDAVVSLFPPGIELRFMEAHPERFVRLDGIAGQWGVFGVRR